MGIFAKNREEWAVADLACLRSSVTIVPFFDSLGPDALTYVINQTELTTICIDKTSLNLIIKMKEKIPSLSNLILFDELTDEEKETA